jgi:uncharacterized protein YehS (DUF1456 family)
VPKPEINQNEFLKQVKDEQYQKDTDVLKRRKEGNWRYHDCNELIRYLKKKHEKGVKNQPERQNGFKP